MKIKQLSLLALFGILLLMLIACSIAGEQLSTNLTPPPTAVTPTPSVSPIPIVSTTQRATSPPESVITFPVTRITSEPATVVPSPTETVTKSFDSTEKLPATDTYEVTVVSPSATSLPEPFTLITSFDADVEETDPGETITLSWGTTDALTVTLWHLAATGQFSQFWTVPTSGTFEYTVAAHERNRTTFALSAQDAIGNNEMATVEINLRCPDEWFFTSHPDICPANSPLVSAGAEQHFEGGTMIWVAGEDRIYVLFNDGQLGAWQAYSDNWAPGDKDRDPNLAPPATFYQPVRGFGQVWREQPGIRERLGWAISEEVAFEVVVQRTSYAKYNETYILASDGGIWRLMAERSGWDKLPDGAI